MGAADIVPGVSGGTVALILGVYERLLAALSRFDSQTVGLVLRGHLGEAWRRVDAWFLVALAGGIGVGVKGLAGVMTYLLSEQATYTYAAFFGLILASGWLVARLARPATPLAGARCVAIGLMAAAFAVWLMSQGRMAPLPGLLYTFVCGMIAICAMILPGISGAYLLLILGKYEEMSALLHRAPSISGYEWATLGVFLTGCLIGILSMSRVLKWLLAHYWSATMAALAGFMIGSLYRVWPFQTDTTPEVEDFKFKLFQPVLPETFDGTAAACLVIAVACFAAVFVIDWLGRRVGEAPEEVAESLASEAS
jgi:putative membrane protein